MEILIPFLAQLFFYLSLPLVTVYAWVFGYHWYQYGTEKKHGTIALIIFLTGAILCVGVMFVSLQYVN
jgi:hypothetical protein